MGTALSSPHCIKGTEVTDGGATSARRIDGTNVTGCEATATLGFSVTLLDGESTTSPNERPTTAAVTELPVSDSVLPATVPAVIVAPEPTKLAASAMATEVVTAPAARVRLSR
jgi:hypothetical protein